MQSVLHKFCNTATSLLHESFNDTLEWRPYSFVMDTKTEAGRRIKSARIALEMRLEDVCSRIPELTVSRLSNWEQGRNMIGVEEAKKLSPVLKVSAAYILTLEDDPGDSRLRALVELYRQSDERGKASIFRVAESESAFVADSYPPRSKGGTN